MQQSSYNNYGDYIMIIMISIHMNNLQQNNYNNIAIHCWKLFSAQAVILAVLVGVTLSANLDSSSSLAKAKQLVVVVNGCCSLVPEGGRSSLGCGHDASVARQCSACSRTHTEAVSNGQATIRLWS